MNNNLFSAYKKYGVPKSTLTYFLTKKTHFPKVYNDALARYFILYWEPKYFLSQLKDGKITRDGEVFNVVYLNVLPACIKNYPQIFLSFRKPQPEFNLQSYVVISFRKKENIA